MIEPAALAIGLLLLMAAERIGETALRPMAAMGPAAALAPGSGPTAAGTIDPTDAGALATNDTFIAQGRWAAGGPRRDAARDAEAGTR